MRNTLTWKEFKEVVDLRLKERGVKEDEIQVDLIDIVPWDAQSVYTQIDEPSERNGQSWILSIQ